MRKILVILGLVLVAGLMEGITFFISSQMPGEPEVQETEEPALPSTFDEMLASALTYKEQRQFDMARGYIQMALDRAKTAQERVAAGYQMGDLLYDDYLQGGNSRLTAAASYLQAAYDDCASESPWRVKIGLVLLDVLEEMGETDQATGYLEEMLAVASDSEEIIQLWRRKFGLLMGVESGWREMNEALAVAESLPVQSAAWADLIAEMLLRSREKLLADESWFNAYSLIGEHDDPQNYRQRLFEEVEAKLNDILGTGDKRAQDEALFRLANAMISIGKYEEGQVCLTQFLERDPRENLTEALMLMSRISRGQGEVVYAALLAESLIRRYDFNIHTREEILYVVELLEEHDLFEDALGLLEGCFSLVDNPGIEYGKLIGRAAVLEEQLGDSQSALAYMNQLLVLDVDEDFGEALLGLIDLNMERGNYTAVEDFANRFISNISPSLDVYGDVLFPLFEAKYWLDRPVLEQLFVGAAAMQHDAEDPRVASVQLRMARYIEAMKLNELAISYFNRIGLMNFFQSDSLDTAFSQNIGEQAMLGKARCLKKLENWVAADHLYREICNRTKSPLVKSEAAVGWAELAGRFGQSREALRRYDLAYAQMLSGEDQVRYELGRSRLQGEEQFSDPSFLEDTLSLLDNLPEEEQRGATISFFNETFDYLHDAQEERAMLRLIDLAYQSDFVEWLPIQSYVLRLYEDKFRGDQLVGLGGALRDKDDVAGASLADLAQVTDKLESLIAAVKRHKKKAIE